MSVFIFIHILAMFTAVAFAQGPLIVLMAAVARRDVPAIRGQLTAQMPLVRWIGPLFGLGILLGLLAVFTNGFNPLRPWLLIAYVLTIIAAVLPQFSSAAYGKRLGMALANSPGDTPSAELAAVMDDSGAKLLIWIDFLVIAALIADMVIKPFGF